MSHPPDQDPGPGPGNDHPAHQDGLDVVGSWQPCRYPKVGKSQEIDTIRGLTSLGRITDALRALDDADSRYPDDFYLTVLRSEALEADGDWAGAFQHAEAAVVLDPTHMLTAYRAGRLAVRLRRFPKALDHFRQALVLFHEREFAETSVFPLQCLLRIHAVLGYGAAGFIGAQLERLASRGHRPFIEISPFLARIARDTQRIEAETLRLGWIATDPRSILLYGGRDHMTGPVAGYGVTLQDHDQYSLALPDAHISASFGAVWADGTCFALDHGFHSSNCRAEFDLESKNVLTHDEALLSFSMVDQTVLVDASRPVVGFNADVLVVPPCHHVNYGHFAHDVLALKFAFDRLRSMVPGLQVLLLRPFPNDVFRTVFERTFGSDYIQIDGPGMTAKVRSAHLVTLPHAMWPNTGRVCCGPARYLRRHLQPAESVATERIFIARRDAVAGDAAGAVRETFERLGFRSVVLEELATDDYFATFAQASHIAGMHGAGLMNFLFAPAGVRIAECKRPGGNWHSIATFAMAAGADITTFELPETGADWSSVDQRIARWAAAQPPFEACLSN